MLKTIFAQETKADAETQWDAVADALREKGEKLGTFMDASRDDVLAYMDFPREHWAQIASTNPLERVNREIKRRADVIGIFPNDDAIIRLVGALMLETNDEWTVARRYMSLETLARVTDNPGDQGRDGWHRLRRLRQQGAGARDRARHRRHPRQSGHPQERRGDPRTPGPRLLVALPAALLARPHSHRTGLLKAQGSSPKDRRTDLHRAVRRHRRDM